MPSTARTAPTLRLMSPPPVTGKCILSPSTLSSALSPLPSPPGAAGARPIDARLAEGASWVKRAARRGIHKVRRHAGDRFKAFLTHFVQARHRLEQAQRVRVAWGGIESHGGGALDNLARIHHLHPVADARDHS